ncbi:MAG: hypothetical protein PHC61_08325, partial [Chitinivibrionales bacterium]|nr:hypothetical protein [Chitinivibrionales bacterium]
ELAQGVDSLKPEQRGFLAAAQKHLSDAYKTAGAYQLEGIKAMQNAPVPAEIKAKPLYYYQYLKQLLETLEPQKKAVRAYYLDICKDAHAVGLPADSLAQFQERWAQTNFMIGNDYEKLAAKILREPQIPTGMGADEKEKLLFQLEDIVYELQDEAVKRYEEAMQLARQENLRHNDWYGMIMESLARLSPENYGKTYYRAILIGTDKDWIVRGDGPAGWNNKNMPPDGWRQAVTISPAAPAFPNPAPEVLWADNKSIAHLFFCKPVFINGIPRSAALRVSCGGKYNVFVNGALTLSDTIGTRGLSAMDSAVTIHKLMQGGDNVIAIEAWAAGSGGSGVALQLSALLDTSEQFTSTMQLPAEFTFAPKTPAIPASGQEPSGKKQAPLAQSYTRLYKNYGEFKQAFVDYDRRVLAATSEMKKEHVLLQKLQIQDNYYDTKIKAMAAQIDSLKSVLGNLHREK